jgi:hypothetical protein
MFDQIFRNYIFQIDTLVYDHGLPILLSDLTLPELNEVAPYSHYCPSRKLVMGVGFEAIKHVVAKSPYPLRHGCYIIWRQQLTPYVKEMTGRRIHVTPENVLYSMATKIVWMRIQDERKQHRSAKEFLTANDFAQNLPLDFPIAREKIESLYKQEIQAWEDQHAKSKHVHLTLNPIQALMSQAEMYFASNLALQCDTPERIAEFYRGCRETGLRT